MTEGSGSGDAPPRPGPAKGPAAFRSISEASAAVGVAQHVLRFWETRFSFIRPTKRAGGRRFYRPQDLDVLRGVRALLQDEGYTIKGVQKLHREQGLKSLLAAAGLAADRMVADDEPGPRGDDATPPPAHAASADRDEEDGTGDLFAEVPDEDPRADSPPTAAPRHVLARDARARLVTVLGDLEGAKARIDALLQRG